MWMNLLNNIIAAIFDLSPIVISLIFLKRLDVRSKYWKKRIEDQLVRYDEFKSGSRHIVNIVADVNLSFGFISSFIIIIVALFSQFFKVTIQPNIHLDKLILLFIFVIVYIFCIRKIYKMDKDLLVETIIFQIGELRFTFKKVTWEFLFKSILCCGYLVLVYVVTSDRLTQIAGLFE